MMHRTLGAVALALLCSASVQAADALPNPDPWESFNRKVFAFNDRLDRYFLKPVAKGYRKITPQFVDDGLTNLFNNLGEPVTIVNDLLQGKVVQSARDTGRFIVNSTVGIAGLVDVARHIKLPRNEEDFGQTFAKWGLPAGPYVVVPFMYGMTVRDGVGLGAGGYMTSRLLEDGLDLDWREELGLLVLDVVDTRADLIPMEDSLQMTGDRYRLIRDAWLQRRDFLIKDGLIEEDPFLDDDESYDDEPATDEGEPPAEAPADSVETAPDAEADDGAATDAPQAPVTEVSGPVAAQAEAAGTEEF